MLNDKLELKALVTGASGFIGGRLRDALLDAGADVVAIRRPSSPQPKRGRSAVAAYDDERALARIMREEKPDLLFHVAGATKGVSYDDFQRANVMPTVNLITAVKQEHPELSRFVMVSSLTSYGPSKPAAPHTESSPRRPIEHYGKSKQEAEERLEAEGDDLRWTILRPGGVYGPGDGDFFALFREASKGRNVFYGNRKRLSSVVYVDDLVRACVNCTKTDASLSKGYFICDGEPITWENFQQLIVDSAGRRVFSLDLPEFLVGVAALGGEIATKIDKKPRLFNRQKAKMGAQEAWTCVHDAAREDFGYEPEVPVREGVKRAFAWYREHGWL